MPNLIPFPAAPDGPVEPDWSFLIPERPDGAHDAMRASAHDEWKLITTTLSRAGTLATENGHQIRRLVLAYLRYDVAASMVMGGGEYCGPVISAKTGTPLISMWQVELRAADADATMAERELCLTPRRRASAGKVERRRRAPTAADSYLKRPDPGDDHD